MRQETTATTLPFAIFVDWPRASLSRFAVVAAVEPPIDLRKEKLELCVLLRFFYVFLVL